MTVEEKVDSLYAKVNNGLSENVAETRKDVKELRRDMHELITKWDVFVASRGATCPYSKERGQLQMRRKADVKYYVTTAIALGAVAIGLFL
jgi:hypothetical protein